jgi:tight adherence protein C
MQRARIKTRLNVIEETRTGDEVQEPLDLPFHWRVLKPLGAKMVKLSTGFLPVNVLSTIEEKLTQGGNPRGMRAGTFVTIVMTGALLAALIALGVTLLLGLNVVYSLIYAVGCLLLFIILAAFWLLNTVGKRISQIDLTLPDAIDLLVVSVEAGLGFDLALSKVTEKIQGPLMEEFSKTLQEMKMGKPRQTALKDLSRRVGSHNLTTFLSMIIQGTQMGISMGQILRAQSETMRLVRRQRLEETIMKLPVKLVFPLVLCIFPALMIVILGPALIQFARAF